MNADVELDEAGGLAYRSAGSGRPLVLLHTGTGLDGSTLFREVLSLTERGRRVTASAIAAEHDPLPRQFQRRIADASPRGTLAVVEGAGHFPFIETADSYEETES